MKYVIIYIYADQMKYHNIKQTGRSDIYSPEFAKLSFLIYVLDRF